MTIYNKEDEQKWIWEIKCILYKMNLLIRDIVKSIDVASFNQCLRNSLKMANENL